MPKQTLEEWWQELIWEDDPERIRSYDNDD